MNLSSIKKNYDLKYIEENPVTYAEDTSIEELEQFIKYANHYYHNTDKTLVSDYAYDEVKNILERRDPSNPILNDIGAPIDGTKVKVELPYWMGSMTKIKLGDGGLSRFNRKYNNKKTISDKLDGISGLICFNHDNKYVSAYTRGAGNVGANIDYIVPYLNLPKIKKKIAIRGEFVIKKSVFADLKKDKEIIYKNTRSFVAGVINHKTPNIKHLKLIDFVVYELVHPLDKSSNQFKILQQLGFNVVYNQICNSVNEKQLEKMYMERLELTDYDIDGLIITDDDVYPRPVDENPKYSRAFKMDLKKYETKVLDVKWNPSKDGLLKPVVMYEPVMIGGNKNVKATCNNARFVVKNKIGKGAIIEIIRTNDVLPKVVGIVKPAKHIAYPDVDYKWNINKVEFVVKDLNNNEDVSIKRLVRFFTTLKIDNINEGILRALYQSGYTSIDDILRMEIDDYLEIEGFKEKLATKIYNNIHDVIDNPISLATLMTASNAFQDGFAEKKLNSVIKVFPDLLENEPDIEDIVSIDGWSYKTGEPFLERLENFVAFLDEHPYLKYKLPKLKNSKSSSKSGPSLEDKKVIFSGVRNKQLETIIEDMGGHITSSISKNTDYLLTVEPDGITNKLTKARDLGIPIMTIEQFCKKFDIKL